MLWTLLNGLPTGSYPETLSALNYFPVTAEAWIKATSAHWSPRILTIKQHNLMHLRPGCSCATTWTMAGAWAQRMRPRSLSSGGMQCHVSQAPNRNGDEHVRPPQVESASQTRRRRQCLRYGSPHDTSSMEHTSMRPWSSKIRSDALAGLEQGRGGENHNDSLALPQAKFPFCS
jgi:hypothetical protein